MYNERIREYREDREITKKILSKYERGIKPSLEIIKKISDIIEIKIDDLFK